jgi:hypothetical protein
MVLALGFGLFVTLVGKKHDRYLLPAFPALTLAAALGWAGLGKSRDSGIGVTVSNLRIPNLPFVVLSIQFLLILPYLPAPLGYFNPLVGGPRVALKWLPVGWGEGLGAAAHWLNQQPEAERLIVATPSLPSFASLFVGQTALLDGDTLSQADYFLSLPQQESKLSDLQKVSLYEHRIGGVSYVNVVRNPVLSEQAVYLSRNTHPEDLIVFDAETALARLYEGPADVVVLADARDAAEIRTRLASIIPDHRNLWYVALPVASPITSQQIQRQLACYGQLIISNTVAGATISQIALDPAYDPQLCDASQANGTQQGPTGHSTHYPARFGDAVTLIDAHLPNAPIAWPDPLFLTVRWEALASPPDDYGVILHLKDEVGRLWVDGGQEMLDDDYGRSTAWSPGDWSDQTFQLALPPAIPPGRYTLELGVFIPTSGRGLSVWDADGMFAGLSVNLGQVVVAPPSHPPTPWHMVMSERFDPPLAAGPLALWGANLPPERIASGDRVSFDLFWQATTAPAADHALRWRLLSSEKKVSIEEIVPLSPYPTTRWRDRELEQVRYDLPAPPDLPVGHYILAVNVLDADGIPLWADDYDLTQLEILARDRLFNLPTDIVYPLDLWLGTMVRLRGFDVQTLAARPGDQISLTLYWQAEGPTDLSYTVFVHLIGSDGMIHGQVDRPPLGGAAPTHSWAPGQVIVDEIPVPVLSDTLPGSYRVVVGLYDPVSGDRLPVYDTTGGELPNRQTVLPIEVTIK